MNSTETKASASDAEAPAAPVVIYLSPQDERANVATHGLGFVLSLAAGIYFAAATRERELGLHIACIAFCATMAIVYLFSTLSHAVHDPHRRHRLRAWDQGTIYLLIVGTYTPFIWQATEGGFRTGMLALVWLIAGLGFYSKVFAAYRVSAVSTATYLALGWLPAIPLIRSTPWICFVWMLLGGLCYSLGVLFLKQSARIRYSHAAWHVMVMLGSACHCYAIHKLLVLT